MFCYDLYGVMLVFAIALVTFSNAISANNGFNTTLSDSQHASFGLPVNGDRIERHLRNRAETMADAADSSFEDRQLSSIHKAITMVRQNLKRVGSANIPKMTIEQQANQLFKNNKLLLDQEHHLVFSSQPFLDWMSSVETLHQGNVEHANIAIVKTLAAHYGDDKLAEMLIQAKTSPKMRNVATSLEEVQFKDWVNTKKNAEDIYTLLKLDQANIVTLEDPLIKTWTSFVVRLDPEDYSVMMWPVLQKYFKDPAGLAKMLAQAKNSPRTKGLAIRLEEAQFKSWEEENLDAKGVFKLLKLDPTSDVSVENPLMMTWASFVTRLYPKDDSETMLYVLKAHCKDKAELAKMLVHAKTFSITKDVAARDEEALLNKWLDEKLDAEGVYTLLKLDQANIVTLEDPLIKTWTSFMVRLDPEDYCVMMWPVLQKYFKDPAGLAKILAQAKKSPRTKVLAIRLEEAQFKSWEARGKTASDILKLLKLDPTSDVSVENPLMMTWASFVTRLYPKDDSEMMLYVLKIHCKDEAEIAKMLVHAKTFSITEDVAARDEEALLNKWLDEKLDAEGVYTLLKLDQANIVTLEDPLMKTWASFMVRLDPEDYCVMMWPVLQKYFKDPAGLAKILAQAKKSPRTKVLAIRLEEAQFKSWEEENLDAKGVFKLLKLDPTSDVSVENPLMMTWASFVTRLYPKDDSETMLYVLKAHCKDEAELAKMLVHAKTFSITKDVAARDEEALLNKWLDKKLDAKGVFELLKLDRANEVSLEDPLVELWASFVAKLNKENHIKLTPSVEHAYNLMAKDPTITKWDGKAKPVAARYAKIQFKEWIDADKSALDIYYLLKLDQVHSDSDQMARIRIWVSFVEKLDEKNHVKLMLSVLKDHYTDKAELAKMLIRAKESPKTKDLATRLEEGLDRH